MWKRLFLLLSLVVVGTGCEAEEERALRLPDPDSLQAWYGEGTQVELRDGVVEIEGSIPAEFLARGGSLWRNAAPYFYLFNVRIRDLLVEYPDVRAVRAVVRSEQGEELARATLHRASLNPYEWEDAVALASLAQTEGTRSPRRLERLIRWGEEHTEYRYVD